MPAILIAMGTKYACNLGYVGDQICLQSWLCWGPNMHAILVQKGTKYACNFSHDRDHISLQSYLIGTIYACNFENFKITFKVIVLGQKAV